MPDYVAGAAPMSKGHIWPEYWIDCSTCDHHEPLGMKTKSAAVTEALILNWGRSQNKWVCPDCQGKAVDVSRANREAKL